MADLAKLIPELENKRHEKVDEPTLVYALNIVDVWAETNGLVLFQIFSVHGAGTFFIFNTVLGAVGN